MEFNLPPVVTGLVQARNRLREHYTTAALEFTLDGNLVGDIGEAVAAELFGLRLSPRNGTGIDGHAADGRSVQVKATGRRRGPAFRMVDTRADHLLFLDLDFETCKGWVLFNGPEHFAISLLPKTWEGQRSLTRLQIVRANSLIAEAYRLPLVTEKLVTPS